MAKKSMVSRDKKRLKLIAKFASKLAKLKELRNSSPTRHKNRDSISGRPRGYMRQFGLSRINFREKAAKGEIPGITKSSW